MADTSVKLSGTYDSIEAYNIMVEMQNMSADYEEIRTEAAAAASAATAASAAATNAVNVANTAATNAQTYAGNANTSAGEAAGYASDASTAAANAAGSETNASNSATAAATSAASAAASEAVVAGALPLSGGTMTGPIVSNGIVLKNEANDSYTEILAGTDETSSYISMYGKNYASNPGRINIRAYDGTNSKYLVLLPNGEFTWNSNTIMTHGVVNGHGIQSGRISCGSIPAGGNVTGTINFPAPFSGTPNVVCVQSSDASLLYHCVGEISSTGFRWRINSARTGNITATIDWIAIY